ncbi:MAG: NAD-dependent epimerase/dehydratase family protein [Planctomycetota bacterium]|nr:NAD-dependent epimerase/dehydratase family protein [Planctomycetota bacterium]
MHGLIGWHARCAYLQEKDISVIPAGRAEFESAESLQAFVAQCDAIVHFAGMNRGEEEEVYRVNLRLAHELIAACKAIQAKPHILFSNSTHSLGASRYGASKRDAADAFGAWAELEGARFTNLILPHVFGEHGRPFYNSVVHTFCAQIAKGEKTEIHVDADLELLHASEVAALALECIRNTSGPAVDSVQPAGVKMKTSELLEKLQAFDHSYRGERTVPDLRSGLDLCFFNTYRAALYPAGFPVDLTLHSDERGWLFEAVRENNGGQTFLSTTRPGITRGNHFHYHKVERFLVVSGEAVIRIRRLFDDKVEEFHVSGERHQFVDMPTLHTHEITNLGESNLLTLFWSHEIFDPEAPDTVWEKVQ